MVLNSNQSKILLFFVCLLTGFFGIFNFGSRTETISTDYIIGYSFSLQLLLLIEFILICIFKWSQFNLEWIDAHHSRIILKLDLFCCFLMLLVSVFARHDVESVLLAAFNIFAHLIIASDLYQVIISYHLKSGTVGSRGLLSEMIPFVIFAFGVWQLTEHFSYFWLTFVVVAIAIETLFLYHYNRKAMNKLKKET